MPFSSAGIVSEIRPQGVRCKAYVFAHAGEHNRYSPNANRMTSSRTACYMSANTANCFTT